MTAPVPIAHQVAAVERIARREATPDILAALATLRLIADHADGLRALIKYLRAADLQPGETPSAEETRALMAHPAIAEIVRHFPDAEVTAIHPVTPPAPEAGDPTDEQPSLDL
jgi:hypothetical protein